MSTTELVSGEPDSLDQSVVGPRGGRSQHRREFRMTINSNTASYPMLFMEPTHVQVDGGEHTRSDGKPCEGAGRSKPATLPLLDSGRPLEVKWHSKATGPLPEGVCAKESGTQNSSPTPI